MNIYMKTIAKIFIFILFLAEIFISARKEKERN